MDTINDVMKHCVPINYADYDPLPADHFCTYPVFCSKATAEAIEASATFTANWKRACKLDGLHQDKLDFQACTTHLGHYNQWAYPDCLPERVSLNAVLSDCAFFWDDVSDSISAEKMDELTQDFGIAMLSELQSGRRIEPTFEINRIAVQVARDLIAVDPFTGIGHLKGWKGHLDAQERSTHNNMSWEQYVEHRVNESGGNWGISFGCWTNDIRISDEEKESVRYLTQLACAGGILGNDYYSFPKEFDEHHRSGTLDRLQNGVALFMREYGYTEEEAKEIIKAEVIRREKEWMDGFDAWSRQAGPESGEVRRYLVMTMALMSGSMFWMAHAGRYHRTDLATTAEDRATIIGKAHGALRVLEGYPLPKGMEGIVREPRAITNANGHEVQAQAPALTTQNGNGHAQDEHHFKERSNGSNGNGSVSNGVYVQPFKAHGTCTNCMAAYTAPFQEAPGEASPLISSRRTGLTYADLQRPIRLHRLAPIPEEPQQAARRPQRLAAGPLQLPRAHQEHRPHAAQLVSDTPRPSDAASPSRTPSTASARPSTAPTTSTRTPQPPPRPEPRSVLAAPRPLPNNRRVHRDGRQQDRQPLPADAAPHDRRITNQPASRHGAFPTPNPNRAVLPDQGRLSEPDVCRLRIEKRLLRRLRRGQVLASPDPPAHPHPAPRPHHLRPLQPGARDSSPARGEAAYPGGDGGGPDAGLHAGRAEVSA
ncbi:uncharacterized protein DSM5745_00361 [Aspergillus mulundensis]|uniref:Terpene synthase n=1 Tax=Aspergillus mulundensis TaxID=1810919 RepID=A0A3D8T3E0_9EURO|nr:hypothetical protein DSM5745_00361 [Aspergillus mulundensis]RDW93039.1 hypothetical protein DSM5745_00361 [Aspergillus mulundensis]